MQTAPWKSVSAFFLLAGILALLLLALRVSGLSPSPSTDTYKLYAYFDNIAGLTVRAKVTMAGVTIWQGHGHRSGSRQLLPVG